MQMWDDYLQRLGSKAIGFTLALAGSFKLFVSSIMHVRALANTEVRKVFHRQIYFTGVQASVTLAMLGAVVGMVIITQVSSIAGNNPMLINRILAWTVIRELGALCAAVIIIARSSTAMASELGSMKVNGEIDVLRSLGISVMDYLVMPRVLGTVVCLVILTFYFQAAAVLGGLLLSSLIADTSIVPQLKNIFFVVGLYEIFVAFFKSALFGAFIAAFSCYHGLNVSGSITGIPQATSRAVVQSLSAVIMFDGIITVVFFT